MMASVALCRHPMASRLSLGISSWMDQCSSKVQEIRTHWRVSIARRMCMVARKRAQETMAQQGQTSSRIDKIHLWPIRLVMILKIQMESLSLLSIWDSKCLLPRIITTRRPIRLTHLLVSHHSLADIYRTLCKAVWEAQLNRVVSSIRPTRNRLCQQRIRGHRTHLNWTPQRRQHL